MFCINLAALTDRLESLLVESLKAAEKELGRSVNRAQAPEVMGRLVDAWAANDPAIDPEDSQGLQRRFAELAEGVVWAAHGAT